MKSRKVPARAELAQPGTVLGRNSSSKANGVKTRSSGESIPCGPLVPHPTSDTYTYKSAAAINVRRDSGSGIKPAHAFTVQAS